MHLEPKNINYLRKYSFEIKSRSFNKNYNKSKFIGKIEFIYDSRIFVLIAYRIIISECWIDLATTESWLDSKNSSFKRRDELFTKLNLEQIVRSNSTKNKIVHINDVGRLKIINDYLENEYKSTIKNVDSLFSGSNPSGELSNSKKAPIIAKDPQNIIDKNFAIFFKNYSIFEEKNYSFKDYWSDLIYQEIKYENYFNSIANSKNENIKKLVKFIKKLNQNNDNHTGKLIVNFIKQIVDIQKINNKIAQKRREFAKNIKNKKEDIFEFTSLVLKENAHIYSVSNIKNKIIQEIIENSFDIENKRIKELFNYISDENNYLNLDSNLHTIFDKEYFTYDDTNGKIIILNEEKINQSKLLDLLNNNYSVIPRKYLNERRRYFLNLRNKNLFK
ncbi:MAG4270 family putative restriction endonuclease [Mycoplasma leonicaptivi]|uniref:MAG4270 family putative restriction endonuclease n=1 Tax=Mycoplasma leonicaptivi TaxID=36742 RepID=UPI0004816B69|nr:HNH endonuclease [Mycoplasma leonicaptivi]